VSVRKAIVGLVMVIVLMATCNGPGFRGWANEVVKVAIIEDLQAIPEKDAGNYVLVNDIDASATVTWNGGKGFKPIMDFAGTQCE
jgi:hypothetical protein